MIVAENVGVLNCLGLLKPVVSAWVEKEFVR